jgi:hypothetical protein
LYSTSRQEIAVRAAGGGKPGSEVVGRWATDMLAGVPLGMVADRWSARRTAVGASHTHRISTRSTATLAPVAAAGAAGKEHRCSPEPASAG